jgi:hypothetical protein
MQRIRKLKYSEGLRDQKPKSDFIYCSLDIPESLGLHRNPNLYGKWFSGKWKRVNTQTEAKCPSKK